MTSIDCPSCGRVDSIQKITAIVEGETHHTTGHSRALTFSSTSGKQDFYAQENAWKKTKIGQGKISGDTYGSSFESINAVQRSNLAQKLMPPDKPKPPAKPDFISWLSLISSGSVGIIVGLIVGIIAMIAAFIAIIFLAGEIAKMSDVAVLIGIVVFLANFFISPLIGVIIGVIACIMVGMVFGYLTNKIAYPSATKREMERKYDIALKEHLEYHLPRWESAMQRWNSMFYCRRCDVIFVSGDEVYCNGADNVINLAYHNV